MSGPEAAAISPFKQVDDGPVFDEPWQAQLLAIADTLSKSGTFTATDWSATLGEELRHAEADGAPDNATTYYEAALKALERLLVRGGIATSDVISERRDAWIRAFLATEHGQPVKLGGG